jgi:peptidyl-tRNA hydrolase
LQLAADVYFAGFQECAMTTVTCCNVATVAQLQAELLRTATGAGLACDMVTSNGRDAHTFVPTVLAIGPGYKSDLNKITGRLPLL